MEDDANRVDSESCGGFKFGVKFPSLSEDGLSSCQTRAQDSESRAQLVRPNLNLESWFKCCRDHDADSEVRLSCLRLAVCRPCDLWYHGGISTHRHLDEPEVNESPRRRVLHPTVVRCTRTRCQKTIQRCYIPD